MSNPTKAAVSVL